MVRDRSVQFFDQPRHTGPTAAGEEVASVVRSLSLVAAYYAPRHTSGIDDGVLHDATSALLSGVDATSPSSITIPTLPDESTFSTQT
jgi:hypothetical protein